MLLAALEQRERGEGEAVRQTHFELAALMRGAADRQLRREGDSLSDEEWLAGLPDELERAGLDPALQDDLSQLLERCTAVRYGGAVPTAWAVDETFALARGSLEQLSGRAPAPAAAAVGEASP